MNALLADLTAQEHAHEMERMLEHSKRRKDARDAEGRGVRASRSDDGRKRDGHDWIHDEHDADREDVRRGKIEHLLGKVRLVYVSL